MTKSEAIAALIFERLQAAVLDEIQGLQEDSGIELSDTQKACIEEIVNNKIEQIIKEYELQI